MNPHQLQEIGERCRLYAQVHDNLVAVNFSSEEALEIIKYQGHHIIKKDKEEK